ncbi:phosphoenolpyruvate hydrolase family protein [Planktotalea sp.]|uniref:phosphoenolpyruvate hydrolase family protein n=1 Tax=Planktotalea sp. TaxID=2029877 RepID=UPI0032980BBE
MSTFTISGKRADPDLKNQHIYCPSLQGLSARLADAAFLMPRMDQNRHVKNASGHGHWAAAIAADPFGSNSAFFNALRTAGYNGVVNWPSSILLEGDTQQQMSTIPATPSAEYQFLANAQDAGMQTMGFILTPDHAADALAAGIKTLILHPGILLDVDFAAKTMIRRALEAIIVGVKKAEPKARVYLYVSDWHERMIDLTDMTCDGFVRFEEAPQ